MENKIECEHCKESFDSERALMQHTNAKHQEAIKEPKFKTKKKVRNWVIFIVIIGLFAWWIVSATQNSKTLPPIDLSGHVEQNPSTHVLREPMPIPIQKHMLEHSDGSGPPGVIINYNCQDYQCEIDLIPKLEEFAIKYPEFVYVAPFRSMDAKIALTRYGQIEILDLFDLQMIENFINKD